MKARGLVLDAINQLGGASPSPTTLHDFSRYRSDGTITTASWTQLPSQLWALEFNQANPDHVVIPDTFTQLDFTSEDFSIIIVVNADDFAGEGMLICRGQLATSGYRLQLRNVGRLDFFTSQNLAEQYSRTSNGSLVIGTWYTLGLSRHGVSVRLYINGVDSTSTVGLHFSPTTNSRDFTIGTYDDLAVDTFDGKIALLHVFNYALSPAQHRAIYHSTKWLFGVAS